MNGFVPEGQPDSSQARSAWVAMQKGPRPEGTVEVMVSPEWHKDKEHLGRFIAPEGLEDSAQGFNPGNRPPGRRALKGRQMRRRRNGREEHIYLGAESLHFVLVRIILAIGRLSLCLANTLFPFGSNRTPLAHVISRPFRRTAFLDVSQG